MEYSFEIIRRSRGLLSKQGDCELFCKLDCQPEELNFIRQNRLLNTLMYEINEKPKISRRVLNGVVKIASAPSDPKKRQKQNERLNETSSKGITLSNLIRGCTIKTTEFESIEIEEVITARLLEIGTTVSVALTRDQGRTGVI